MKKIAVSHHDIPRNLYDMRRVAWRREAH
jgi:hypothetical protein